jgi:hypothetical protein
LAAKKLVVLSFISTAFARGCKDNETCADWTEYLRVWQTKHSTDGQVITVSPTQRGLLLRKPRAFPDFATVLMSPDGGAAIYRGVAVEPQVYESLERVARGQQIDPAWSTTIAKWSPSSLRCSENASE